MINKTVLIQDMFISSTFRSMFAMVIW